MIIGEEAASEFLERIGNNDPDVVKVTKDNFREEIHKELAKLSAQLSGSNFKIGTKL